MRNSRTGKQQKSGEKDCRKLQAPILHDIADLFYLQRPRVSYRESIYLSRVGKATEVYSRITGYYRPIKNWNDGKAQEFKDRKVYDLNHLHYGILLKQEPLLLTRRKKLPKETVQLSCSQQNLSALPAGGEDAAVSWTWIRKISAEENQGLVAQYGVRQAPTLVLVAEERQCAAAGAKCSQTLYRYSETSEYNRAQNPCGDNEQVQ